MSSNANATKSALVLDDEVQVGTVLCKLLAAAGYRPSSFTSSLPFLASVKTSPPELIILDLALGVSDAIDIIRKLEIYKFKGTVLLISGSDERCLTRVKEVGKSRGLMMLPPLQKPFRAAELNASLTAIGETKCTSHERNDLASKRARIDLREALHNRQLELWYQPKIDLKTMKTVGAEALLRARHPQYGILSPADILPPPADPLYQPLSEFVIGQAMEDWKYFSDQKLPLKISINIPISVLSVPDFVTTMRTWLPKDPVFPGLFIEITEDEVTRDIEWLNEITIQLKLMNVFLSIDDFGTGYSTLSRLSELPFTELKLDRSFVAGCALDGGKQSLCAATIEMAHGFGVSVCAEGLESVVDLKTLIELRCDVAQGFLFAKPMPSDALVRCLTGRSNESTGDVTSNASRDKPLARSA